MHTSGRQACQGKGAKWGTGKWLANGSASNRAAAEDTNSSISLGRLRQMCPGPLPQLYRNAHSAGAGGAIVQHLHARVAALSPAGAPALEWARARGQVKGPVQRNIKKVKTRAQQCQPSAEAAVLDAAAQAVCSRS